MIVKLDYYNPKKEEFKTQKESVLLNAREFCKGRKMILIAFENNLFPLPKQYPSENIDDWKEDEMDSTHIIPKETDELLPSDKHRKRKPKKERVLHKHDKRQEFKPEESDDLDDLDKTVTENGKIIVLKKYFGYDSLGDMQTDLYMTEGTPSNKIKADLIRDGLCSFKKDVLNNMTMDRLVLKSHLK